MNNTTEQMRRILTSAIEQELKLEIIGKDVDLSGDDVFMPHLHHGLEIKLLGILKENEHQDIINWQSLKTVVIPAQVVHSSIKTGDMASILIEKNRITFDCNHKMLSETAPIAAVADLGIVPSAVVNFIQSGATQEPPSQQFVGHTGHLLKTLFSALVIVLEKSIADEQTSLTARAADYIIRNYYRHNLSVEDVAAQLGITSNYLVLRFHKETGVTIRQYLIQTRLEQAKLLLQSGRCMVKDAAKLTGWNSAYYFSNCYRHYFGIPPSEAQQQIC